MNELQELQLMNHHLKESLKVQNAVLTTLVEMISDNNKTTIEMTEERMNSISSKYELRSDFNNKDRVIKITLVEKVDTDVKNSDSSSTKNEEEQPKNIAEMEQGEN